MKSSGQDPCPEVHPSSEIEEASQLYRAATREPPPVTGHGADTFAATEGIIVETLKHQQQAVVNQVHGFGLFGSAFGLGPFVQLQV
jgi:hypothetical protein